jgi:erythromycin esterase
MVGLLECLEMYELLAWMRAHNHTAPRPLRWAGTVPGGGSPLPELEAVAGYLRSADPDALPLLEQAADLARRYHDARIFTTLSRYPTLESADQDALTAALSRLLLRMETMRASLRDSYQEHEHATALARLGAAWRLDHFHRDISGRGMSVGTASLDAGIAETVLQLLEDDPQARIVLALHNVHIRKTPHAGPAGLFPAGYHLAHALGDDYRAIAVTGSRGRTGRVRPAPDRSSGFEVSDVPLPALAEHSIETAFDTEAALTIADLRATRPDINDAESFQQTRMEDYFMDVPVFDAFDAIAQTPQTSCTEYVAAHASHQAEPHP